MHYKWDKKLIMITWTMLITFFFFAGMMGLIMWAERGYPELVAKGSRCIQYLGGLGIVVGLWRCRRRLLFLPIKYAESTRTR